jgi:hypothetical protein
MRFDAQARPVSIPPQHAVRTRQQLTTRSPANLYLRLSAFICGFNFLPRRLSPLGLVCERDVFCFAQSGLRLFSKKKAFAF